MTLKRQMLGLAALFLLLPLSILYLFGRLEQAAQLSSAEALRELSERIANDLEPLLESLLDPGTFSPLWVDISPLLDGYTEEWESYGNTSSLNPFLTDLPGASGQAVLSDNTLYFYLKIPNPTPREWQPNRSVSAFDQLRFYSAITESSNAGPVQPFPLIIYSEGESPKTTSYEGRPVLDSVWHQQGDYTHIELAIPAPATLGEFTVCWHSGHQPSAQEFCLLDGLHRRLSLNSPDDHVEARLTALTPRQTRLTLMDRQGQRRFAHDNDLERDLPDGISLMQLIAGRIASLLSPPPQQSDIDWHHREDIRQTTLSLKRELQGPEGQVLGKLILERRLSSLRSQTSQALSDTLGIALVLMGLTLGVLLIYGFWLSRRIRGLRDGVRQSLDAESRYQTPFTPSLRRDEIGELSRTFAELLDELRAYAGHKEAFVSRLTHECRTPVSIITSSLQLAGLSDTESERQAYLQRADQACQRLNQLMTAMGEAARLESLMQRYEKGPLDLSALIREVSPHYGALLNRHVFTCEKPESPLWVQGAGDLLVQALDKLIENARDFTPDGKSITLTLREENGHALLTLCNRGAPIPEDLLQTLFQPYHSRRPTSARSGESDLHLGLGLTIVQLIVRFHGGSAQVYNVVGGVAVELSLPLSGI